MCKVLSCPGLSAVMPVALLCRLYAVSANDTCLIDSSTSPSTSVLPWPPSLARPSPWATRNIPLPDRPVATQSMHGALMASSNRCDLHRSHTARRPSTDDRRLSTYIAVTPPDARGTICSRYCPSTWPKRAGGGGSVGPGNFNPNFNTLRPHLSPFASPRWSFVCPAHSPQPTAMTAPPHLPALRGAAEAKRPDCSLLTAPARSMKASARRRAVLCLLKQPKTPNGR
ncbi:hypothetical protein PMIN01_10972 [Paraphaeosphaeria minitans]|uniref:Secreted protein n=1 Tax=Paraphaeosphaeria minitans TaxID=565426 RepID=A0A9P6GB59_9PLEO|nr:hypothetical protein PMIN01_10972 [Paraphaeosphaeria minitans]